MRNKQLATFQEYVDWYLAREQRKTPGLTIPATEIDRLKMMQEHHSGKLRDWFQGGVWSIATLEDPREVENLIYLASAWTKQCGLVPDSESSQKNYRLLGRVADRAIKLNYLVYDPDRRVRAYYHAIADCHFRLEASSRLVVCSASNGEKLSNPDGKFYLHDGAGRGLAYALFMKQYPTRFEPVEVLLAEQP